MQAAPPAIAITAPASWSTCLSVARDADVERGRVAALLAEARVWPLRALEPGDDLLPASMPDRFDPQVVVVEAQIDAGGRVSDCRVRQGAKFDVLNPASCELARGHYVAGKPVTPGKQRIAIVWTSRTLDPTRRECSRRNGTVPVTSSLWITSDVFKGAGSQNGAALIALDVGTKGWADRCVVLASDVSPTLQQNVCNMAVRRAVVMPAVDRDGKLVPARLTMVVHFKR